MDILFSKGLALKSEVFAKTDNIKAERSKFYAQKCRIKPPKLEIFHPVKVCAEKSKIKSERSILFTQPTYQVSQKSDNLNIWNLISTLYAISHCNFIKLLLEHKSIDKSFYNQLKNVFLKLQNCDVLNNTFALRLSLDGGIFSYINISAEITNYFYVLSNLIVNIKRMENQDIKNKMIKSFPLILEFGNQTQYNPGVIVISTSPDKLVLEDIISDYLKSINTNQFATPINIIINMKSDSVLEFDETLLISVDGGEDDDNEMDGEHGDDEDNWNILEYQHTKKVDEEFDIELLSISSKDEDDEDYVFDDGLNKDKMVIEKIDSHRNKSILTHKYQLISAIANTQSNQRVCYKYIDNHFMVFDKWDSSKKVDWCVIKLNQDLETLIFELRQN